LVDKEELIYRVKQQYYSLLVLNEQIVLLESADSIYASFYKQSKSRVDAGLSDALELSTVENQLMQIRQQLSIVRETKKGLLAKFQRTIQTTLHYTPNGDSIIYKFNFSPSLVGNTVSPKLLVLQSEESLLKKSTALEKSLLAPSFSVGYSSMTVKGWQTLSLTEDKYFGALDRFGSVNIGLFVPLFAHSQKARIAASEILVNQKKMETLSFKQELDDQYKSTLSDFLIQKQILGEFMSKGLPGATLILQTASQKFKLGKISYLDWIGYTNQFIQTNADYLNAVMRYNEDVFELEKLNTQY
jgi:cobalt-zinc-cadmium resistance protein CzcA